MSQLSLIPTRPKGPLLKWIGSKYKYAHVIVSHFPNNYNKYIEPFVGTGAILATLSPSKAVAGDILESLIEIWNLLQNDPEKLIEHYTFVITQFNGNRQKTYEEIRQRYNSTPNGLDLVVLSRTCYGGVIRFTREGKISTPIGPHRPISPSTFASRAMEWRQRVRNVTFLNQHFVDTMSLAEKDDLVYCDPPYVDSQAILYGAQSFSFSRLIEQIQRCKNIGAKVALSIDGKKKSEGKTVQLQIPPGIFEKEIYLECGSAMLKRFQKRGEVMIGEDVHDRLLLTW